MNPTYHRTNLNLYAEDVAYMQHIYGRGWTEQARDIIHQELKHIRLRMDIYNSGLGTPLAPTHDEVMHAIESGSIWPGGKSDGK